MAHPGSFSGPLRKVTATLGPPLDASLVTDTAGRGEHAAFTGAFVGMVAHDLTGQGWSADFTEFRHCPAD
jgi:xylan 1,4-beta-xylosidase